MIGPSQKVVARHANGALVKGYSYDFAPGRRRFHVFADRNASGDPTPVLLGDLKAVFFRDLVGNPTYNERKKFSPGDRSEGRRVEVVFRDNEVLVGTLDGDGSSMPGLFITPADPASNNIAVYAPSTAIRQVRYLPAERPPTPVARARFEKPALPRRLLTWLLEPLGRPRPQARRGVFS
jgi:Family of unknown function (DUF6982)